MSSTKQHLIEQECMDKLGWELSQVASASDNEMMKALREYKNGVKRQQRVTPVKTEGLPTEIAPLSNVRLIKSQIDRKNEFISSDVGYEDDVKVFKESIEKDKAVLRSLIESIKDAIMKKDDKIKRKRTTLNLLTSFRETGTSNNADERHLASIEKQLTNLETELNELRLSIH